MENNGLAGPITNLKAEFWKELLDGYPSGADVVDVLDFLNAKYSESALALWGARLPDDTLPESTLCAVRDVVNGLWSGYPHCCINSYCMQGNHWSTMCEQHKGYAEAASWTEYVPCLECFTSGRVQKVDARRGGFFFYRAENMSIWAFYAGVSK